MAGIIIMHQLSNPNTILGQRKIFYHINMLKNFSPKIKYRNKTKYFIKLCPCIQLSDFLSCYDSFYLKKN